MHVHFLPSSRSGIFSVITAVISLLTSFIGFFLLIGRYRINLELPMYLSFLTPFILFVSIGLAMASLIFSVSAIKSRHDQAILTIAALTISVVILACFAALFIYFIWLAINWFSSGGV